MALGQYKALSMEEKRFKKSRNRYQNMSKERNTKKSMGKNTYKKISEEDKQKKEKIHERIQKKSNPTRYFLMKKKKRV